MPKTELTKEDEILANLHMNEDKKFYDRANFFIASEGIFFNAFVTAILGSGKLIENYIWIPIVICGIGLGLNVIYVLSSQKQLKRLNEIAKEITSHIGKFPIDGSGVVSPKTLRLLTPETAKNSEPEKNWLDVLNNLVYKWAPALLFVGWGIMLGVYIAQLAGVKIF